MKRKSAISVSCFQESSNYIPMQLYSSRNTTPTPIKERICRISYKIDLIRLKKLRRSPYPQRYLQCFIHKVD